jgi:hypothetical protein
MQSHILSYFEPFGRKNLHLLFSIGINRCVNLLNKAKFQEGEIENMNINDEVK